MPNSEKKISCEALHHSIYLAPNEFRHCCKRFFYKGKMKGDVKILDINNDQDVTIENIIESKKQLYNKINSGKENECTGCPYLHKKKWPKINKKNFNLKQISVESTSVCSMKCTYCSDMYFGGLKPNYNVSKTLDLLLEYKSEGNDFEFSWAGGEPTLLKNFEELFQKYSTSFKPRKNMVFSNSLKYSKAIELYLSKNLATLTTSIDAGTPGMFKKIRGVKGISKVFMNIKKYSSFAYKKNGLCRNIIIKYIVTDENISKQEIDTFIENIKSYKLEHCSFQISSNFFDEKLTEFQIEKMLEFFVKLKSIGVQMVYFDYHSSPRMRIGINKLFQSKNKIKSPILIKLYNRILKQGTKDVIIWGAGDTGRLIKNNNFFFNKKIFNIKNYVDKNSLLIGEFLNGVEIKDISFIKENNYPIIVASSAFYDEIYSEILEREINPDRILDQIYC